VLNQIPKLHFRLDRLTELYGLDELEHGMVNEMYNFKTAMIDMVEKLARSSGEPEDVKEVCQTAVRCMSQEHLMMALKFDRIAAVSDLILGITDMRLEGASIQKRGVQLKVEIVTKHQGFTKGHRYFAPRWTKVATAGDDDVSWGDETVHFKRFYLPHGTELSMAVLFTIRNTRSLLSVGHATVLLHECQWERTEGGSMKSGLMTVPVETRSLPRAMQGFLSSDAPTATFRVKFHIENMLPDAAPTPEDAWEMLLRNSTILRMTGNGPQGRVTSMPRASRPVTSRITGGAIAKPNPLEARVRTLEQLVSTLTQNVQRLTNNEAIPPTAAAEDPNSQDASSRLAARVVV